MGPCEAWHLTLWEWPVWVTPVGQPDTARGKQECPQFCLVRGGMREASMSLCVCSCVCARV